MNKSHYVPKVPTHYVPKVPNSWSLVDEKFEKGFQETLKHKEQFGDPNVIQNYKTPEGYRLREWQNNQRMFYKQGKLSQDRIERLEDIGFKWNKNKK